GRYCCVRVLCGSSTVMDLLFFFQAEDGIRDFHVTGVQTCAFRSDLAREQPVMERLIQADGQPHYGIFKSAPEQVNYRDFDFRSRSEERRVGKECRSRRSVVE